MSNYVFQTVRDRRSCLTNWRILRKHSTALTLLPPAGKLEFVAIDTFRLLPKSERRFAYIMRITDRFGTINRATFLRSISAGVIADDFLGN